MQILKADTEIKVKIGPFVDKSDGVTPVTDITLGAADQAELFKHNAAGVTDISSNTFSAIANCDGWYNLTLTAGNLDTEGMLDIIIQDASVCLPVHARFMVVNENVYDSLYGEAATVYLQVDTKQIEGTDATDAINTEVDTALEDLQTQIGTAGDGLTAIADIVWDEVLSKATHNVPQSAAKRLRLLENIFVVHEGTAQGDGGGNNTIQLAADAHGTDDWYEEDWIILTENTGAGQMRHIDSYDGETKIVTVGSDWDVKPDATTDYIIVARSSTHVHEIEQNGLDQINTEVDTALAEYGANTVIPDVAGTAAALHTTTNEKIDAVGEQTDKLDTMIIEESSGNKFTEAALENAPTASLDVDELAAAMKAITGLTEGGTWTWEKIMKIVAAFAAGDWRKSADGTKQELMDAEDGTTVILEQTLTRSPAANANYRNITVKI